LFFSCWVTGQSLQKAQLYLDHSDYRRAVPLYEKITKEAKRNHNLDLQVTAQNGLADCYIDLGATYKAIAILKQNIFLLNKPTIKNYLLLAKTHQLLAISYDKLNLIEDYLSECNVFYSYYKKAAPDKEIYKALYYAYVGRYYNMRYIIDKAFLYTNTAIEIYNKNNKEKEVDPYIFYNAHLFTLRNNGTSHIKTIRFRDSVSYFINKRFPYDNLKKARLLISLAAPNLDRVERINAKDSSEAIYNASIAINYYKKAIKINDKYSGYYNPNSAYNYSFIGLMYFYKKDYVTASNYYSEAINRLKIYSDKREECYSNNNTILLGILNWKTWCLNEMYNKKKDIHLLYTIKNDLELTEKIWIRYSNQNIKSNKDYNINFYADCPYLLMVNNYKKLHDITHKEIYLKKAYEYDQKSRHSSLLENYIKKGNINDISKWLAFNQMLEDLTLHQNGKIIYKNPSNLLKTFKLSYKYIINDERRVLKLFNSNIPKVNELQNSLKQDDALVCYNITGNHSNELAYAFLITKKTIDFIKLNKTPDNTYYFDFNSETIFNALSKNDIILFKNQSYCFYKNFFEPIECKLPKNIKNLTIVPNGVIENFPFDLLLSNPANTISSFDRLPYLIKKFNFNYSLSPSLTKLNLNKESKNNRLTFFAPSFESNKYSDLTFANQKSKEISKEYNADYYSGKSANINSFTNSIATDDIIVLFSHGMSSTEELDKQKGIYLSDGFLSMNEVYNLKANCDFLLLGACETGVGYKSREGNINLARAFTAIGVKSMMLASWKIDEKSSSQIIGSFLNYLDSGFTKSEALQKAKLDYLATASPRMANPLYWAGLNITGNNETIRLQQRNYLLWGFGIILIFAGVWYYRKRKK
jgi:CHAT domain-containing protein